jgi:hypothetical protein
MPIFIPAKYVKVDHPGKSGEKIFKNSCEIENFTDCELQ